MAQPQPQHQNAANTTATTTEQPISQLESIVPSIFVPITEDLTAPVPEFASRSARIRAILSEIDTHAASVQSNLVTLYSREHVRLIQKSTVDDVAYKADGFRDLKPGIDGADLAFLIGNMEAPHNPDIDYNIKDIAPADLTNLIAKTPRQWVVWECMRNAESARLNLESHENHVANVKKVYEAALKKALKEEAQ